MLLRLNEALSQLIKVAIPLVAATSTSTFMALLDGVYLANYSTEAFSALVLAIPMVAVVSAIASGIGIACADKYVKQTTDDKKKYYVSISHVVIIFASLVMTVIALAADDTLMLLYGLGEQTENVIEVMLFETYWNWIIMTFVFQLYLTLILQLLASNGDNQSCYQIIVSTLIVNIILNPVFIFVLDFGVLGAALATLIAYITGCAVALKTVYKSVLFPTFKIQNQFYQNYLRDVVKITYSGILISVGIAVFAVGAFVYNRIALKLGWTELTLYGVLAQISNLVGMVTRGICAAFILVFSKYLAFKDYSNYFPVFMASVILVAIFHVTASLILLFPESLLSLYGIQEQSAIDLSKSTYFLISILFVVNIVPRIVQAVFLSLDSRLGFLSHATLMVSMGVYLATVLSAKNGFTGMLQGQLFGEMIAYLIVVPICFCMLLLRIGLDKKEANSDEDKLILKNENNGMERQGI